MGHDCQLLGVTKNRNELMGQRNRYERCVNAIRERLLAMQIVWVENLLSEVYHGPRGSVYLMSKVQLGVSGPSWGENLRSQMYLDLSGQRTEMCREFAE